MRTRKLVLLVLLAVGATFLLSSCDAILDAIYANNTINVTAYVLTSHSGSSSYYSSVTVSLSGASGATVSAGFSGTLAYSGPYTYAVYYLPAIKKLPNGTYSMTSTFYDAVANYSFSTYYFYDSSNNAYTSFSMPFDGSSTADFAVYF
jgi:hypothetical protein